MQPWARLCTGGYPITLYPLIDINICINKLTFSAGDMLVTSSATFARLCTGGIVGVIPATASTLVELMSLCMRKPTI